MSVEICTRCDTRIDLDENTNGHYFESETDKGYSCEYVCDMCLTDKEIDQIDNKE